MTPLRLPSLFPGALALLVALALAPGAAAQPLLVDDFENGIGPDEFVFGGGEFGTPSITTDTPDGSTGAFQFDVDGDEYGGFTGFGQPIEGGPLDITGLMMPVLEFDAAATGTFTLEINFQNAGGGGNGEIRNALRFIGASGGYQRYRLALSSFFVTQPTFEFDDVAQYVFTVLDAAGDGNTATNETSVQIDNVQFVEGLGFMNDITAFDFDSGDFSSFFFFAGGEGIAATATTDTPDGSANAFHGEIDGDEYNGFAGFGSTIAGAPIDVTGEESLNFFLRANGPAVMEVNIQTGAAAAGDEVREVIMVSDTGGEYIPVSIPLPAFIQSSANQADLSQVFNIVWTFVQLPGDGNTGTTEFAFDIDAVGFGDQTAATANELPPSLASAPSVYPNPTAGTATVAFDLVAPTALRVDVFDVLGRRVATLADGEEASGPVLLAVPTLGAGTYLVRVQTDDGLATTRLTVAR